MGVLPWLVDGAASVTPARPKRVSLVTNTEALIFIMVDRRDRNLVDAVFDIAYDIYVESNFTFDISPVIMSEEFFNRQLSQERRIAREIVEQGIVL